MVAGFKMRNFVDEYKIIFLWKLGKAWNSPKNLILYWSFLKICFEFCQKPKSNLLSDRMLVQGFNMPTLVREYKTIYLGTRDKTLKLFKGFLSILKFPKNLFWSLSKASIESCGAMNIGSRFYNAKFGQRIQNHFSGKISQRF